MNLHSRGVKVLKIAIFEGSGFLGVEPGEVLLMEEIRHSPVELGSLSHDLQGCHYLQMVVVVWDF